MFTRPPWANKWNKIFWLTWRWSGRRGSCRPTAHRSMYPERIPQKPKPVASAINDHTGKNLGDHYIWWLPLSKD